MRACPAKARDDAAPGDHDTSLGRFVQADDIRQLINRNNADLPARERGVMPTAPPGGTIEDTALTRRTSPDRRLRQARRSLQPSYAEQRRERAGGGGERRQVRSRSGRDRRPKRHVRTRPISGLGQPDMWRARTRPAPPRHRRSPPRSPAPRGCTDGPAPPPLRPKADER